MAVSEHDFEDEVKADINIYCFSFFTQPIYPLRFPFAKRCVAAVMAVSEHDFEDEVKAIYEKAVVSETVVAVGTLKMVVWYFEEGDVVL